MLPYVATSGPDLAHTRQDLAISCQMLPDLGQIRARSEMLSGQIEEDTDKVEYKKNEE